MRSADRVALDEETRSHVRACAAALPATLDPQPVAFGFDGFVDTVREVVASRTAPGSYDRIERLDAFADRIATAAAAGDSLAVEWVDLGTRAGGHTAHLGRAFSTLGWDPVLIGTFGTPVRDPFEEAVGEHTLVSIGDPTDTDAVEFADGKVLVTDAGNQTALDWATLREIVGIETLAARIDGTRLLGIGYWGMIPAMATIWRGLIEDLWPILDDPPKFVLVDPADVRQLSVERLRDGFDALGSLNALASVTVSANRAELARLADAWDGDADDRPMPEAAALVRRRTGVDALVGHSPDRATLASENGTVAVRIPRTDDPAMTTSAGDHFNAGLALGRLLGLDAGPTLVLASAVAGRFVRTGDPPTYEAIREFVSSYERRLDLVDRTTDEDTIESNEDTDATNDSSTTD